MDIRFDGQSNFVRPLISEQQVSVSRIFTALREKQPPQHSLESTELLEFERFKQLAKTNANTVQETQSALQASSEIQQNTSHVLRLLTELQKLATRSANLTMEPEEQRKLQERSIQIKQELQIFSGANLSDLNHLIEKYNPALEPSNGTPLGSARHMILNLGAFAITPEEIDSLSTSDPQQSQELGDRTAGLLGYLDALQGRLEATLKMVETPLEIRHGRITNMPRAQQITEDLKVQITHKPGQALMSQSNMAYTDVMSLLEV